MLRSEIRTGSPREWQ